LDPQPDTIAIELSNNPISITLNLVSFGLPCTGDFIECSLESFALLVELNEVGVLLREGFLVGLPVPVGVTKGKREDQNQKSPHGFRYEGLDIHGGSVPYLFFIGQVWDISESISQGTQQASVRLQLLDGELVALKVLADGVVELRGTARWVPKVGQKVAPGFRVDSLKQLLKDGLRHSGYSLLGLGVSLMAL
jgi:hypothetical protein